MRRPALTRPRLHALIFGLLVLVAGPATAQIPKFSLGTSTQKADTATRQDSTRVIQPAEIPTRAAATELRLREIAVLAVGRRNLADVERELDAYSDTLQNLS